MLFSLNECKCYLKNIADEPTIPKFSDPTYPTAFGLSGLKENPVPLRGRVNALVIGAAGSITWLNINVQF
jgi:hypothetical protein